MDRPDAETLGHFAISPSVLAKIEFGLTVDQVNDLTLSMAHAEAAVDLVRWYHDVKEAIDTKLDRRPAEKAASTIPEPAELLPGTVTTVLYRAIADIGNARKVIENAARIKATRHGDDAGK